MGNRRDIVGLGLDSTSAIRAVVFSYIDSSFSDAWFDETGPGVASGDVHLRDLGWLQRLCRGGQTMSRLVDFDG